MSEKLKALKLLVNFKLIQTNKTMGRITEKTKLNKIVYEAIIFSIKITNL